MEERNMTQIGLNETEIESMVSEELLSLGRYTVTAPGGRPIFTKEQRDVIAKAVSSVVQKNNEELIRRLRDAGVSI
jgi:hypothetical protein